MDGAHVFIVMVCIGLAFAVIQFNPGGRLVALIVEIIKNQRVRDFCWVLAAYVRGKVLRQKRYIVTAPIARIVPGASVNRMLALMRWWGYRPMTFEEMQGILEHDPGDGGNVPYLAWDDGTVRLSWPDRDDGWSDQHSFIFRKE